MDFSKAFKSQLDRGLSLEEALLYLRNNHAPPVEVIKAIKDAKGTSLGEAKHIFAKSNAWNDIAEETDKIHQEIIDVIK